jgi:hypothetical protein
MPVTVNLNVEVNANGQIEVFGAPKPVMTNVVTASCKLPVTALYDSTKNDDLGSGLIEFWEPSNDLGNIYAQLAGYDTNSAFKVNGIPTYKTTAAELAKGLQKVLVSELDASAASPFNDPDKYGGANADNYRKCSDFGRLALSVYSHYIFGHVDATAAITNDETVMANMLSLSGTTNVKDGGSASGRYGDWKHLSYVESTDVDSWNVTGDKDDAKLAIALAKEVVKKGLTGQISAVRPFSAGAGAGVQASTENGTLAEIVKQVLGQDASRAMGQDNNKLAPEVHQILKFDVGDTIYVSIKVKKPSVVFSGEGQYLTEQAAQDKVTEEVYNVKIELGESAF